MSVQTHRGQKAGVLPPVKINEKFRQQSGTIQQPEEEQIIRYIPRTLLIPEMD